MLSKKYLESKISINTYNDEFKHYVSSSIDGEAVEALRKLTEENTENNNKSISSNETAIAKSKEKIIELIKEMCAEEYKMKLTKEAEKYKVINKRISDKIASYKNENTLNRWSEPEDKSSDYKEEIKNGTYKMTIIISQHKNYKTSKISYDVRYYFGINTECLPETKTIQSVAKQLNTKEELEKYINGRKKAFAKYFEEEKPPVSAEYERYIKFNGLFLAGYIAQRGSNNDRQMDCL